MDTLYSRLNGFVSLFWLNGCTLIQNVEVKVVVKTLRGQRNRVEPMLRKLRLREGAGNDSVEATLEGGIFWGLSTITAWRLASKMTCSPFLEDFGRSMDPLEGRNESVRRSCTFLISSWKSLTLYE